MIDTGQLVRIALVVFLVIGCFLVLQPFITAILLAAVICISTWSFYSRLRLRLHARDTLAACVMTLLLLLALILPTAYLASHLADSAAALFEHLRPSLENPEPNAPAWVAGLPVIGERLAAFWREMASSHDELMQWLSQFYDPARKFALQAAQAVGGGLLQLILVVVVAFFFYRDGSRLTNGLRVVVRRLGGELGETSLEISCSTVRAVMLGIFGTAVAQAVVAWIGFLVVGAPAPLLLAVATFFLSMIPVGPPLVWIGVTLWLFDHGRLAWGIAMAIYGLVVISGVDNVIKPILISQSARLPILLIVLGVLGGVVSFGFAGIFLGPALLAVGLKLTQHVVALWENKSEVLP